MGPGGGYRPQMALEIMLEKNEPMTSEQVRKQTICTDRRIFGSIMSRLYRQGLVERSGTPVSQRGNKPKNGVFRYQVTEAGREWLKKFG